LIVGLLRLVATLVIAGLALLVLAVALTLQVASAAPAISQAGTPIVASAV
jgi:hypothetical protein